MDPPFDRSTNCRLIELSPMMDITNLSPMSNLALNLSGLSTTVANTPIRRISWTNVLPSSAKKCGANIENILSPKVDSETFKDFQSDNIKSITRKDSEIEYGINKASRSFFSKLPSTSSPIANDRNPGLNDSQESGFVSISSQQWRTKSLLMSSSSLNDVRNSSVSINGDDSLDDIFSLDSGDSQENISMSENISLLLTKPLVKKRGQPTPETRKGKRPTRRCLSMEMTPDFDHISSDYKDTSCDKKVTESDVAQNVKSFKRPEPPNDFSIQCKRRKSSPCIEVPETLSQNFQFQRSYSETAATIMHAILKADLQPDLIGDNSRPYALPRVKGRHHDLKSISPETMARLIQGDFKEEAGNFIIVDCRYPYEFDGGHIQGAKNIFTKDHILDEFFQDSAATGEKKIVIFHCEFSSERAPNLCRFMRNKDRELNQGNYPHLHHPEMYILEGGYKAFFEDHKDLCEPQNYKPMAHKDHGSEMRHFRAKSKSWGADSKNRAHWRPNSKNN